jgi:hypothetical protein
VTNANPSDAENRILVTDFNRSFLRFRLDLNQTLPKTISQPPPFTLNNSRFQLECCCRVTRGEGADAHSVDYVLTASCKAEQVHVHENVWHDPAADMCLIASTEEFLVIKCWDRNDRGVMLSPPTMGKQPERHSGMVADAFTKLQIDRHQSPGRILTTTEEIVAAVLDNRPLVSQSEFVTSDGARIHLEYPVKLVNASEREMFYQIDTGPVLVHDVSAYNGTHAISTLRGTNHERPHADCSRNQCQPLFQGAQASRQKSHDRVRLTLPAHRPLGAGTAPGVLRCRAEHGASVFGV